MERKECALTDTTCAEMSNIVNSPVAGYEDKPVDSGEGVGVNESDPLTPYPKQPSGEESSPGTPLAEPTSTKLLPDESSGDEGRDGSSGDVHDVTEGSCRGLVSSLRHGLRKGNVRFLIACFFGVALGFCLGFGLRPLNISQDAAVWLGLPGELYMRMLQATILPLIICSVIAASNGRVTSVCLLYIVITNAVGAVIAVVVTLIIRPGVGMQVFEDTVAAPSTQSLQTADIFADLIRNLFPGNVVSACFEKIQTVYVASGQRSGTSDLASNSSLPLPVVRSLTYSRGTNLLGLIIFCSVIGMAAAKVGEAGRPFLLFFRSASDVIIQAMVWLVWSTPLGVASLIASSLVRAPDIPSTFRSVGMLVLTVTVGMAFHQLVFIPIVYFVARRQNPLRFMLALSRPWITAFAPPNTMLALPEMIRCCDWKLKVDKQISRTVLPLAVSLNRDGSCLFITATALYIGQLDPAGVSAAQVVLIAVLATVGSLAIPAVPSASIVTLLIILSSLNIPIKNVGLIMALEWYLDRIRSTSNTCSCVLATVVTDRITFSWLKKHRLQTVKVEVKVE